VALDDLIFFDTSVLVAGLIEMGDTSLAADRILDAVKTRRVSRPVTAWHCCLECYSVATRLPAPVRIDPEMARELLEEEVIGRFEIADLPASARSAFLTSASTERVAGGRVYDAHIAECARLAGARIVVTDNRRHFVGLMRYGIRVMTAVEFVDEYRL
jgi:predicted nucleic acid-binding protein